jgi:glucose-6-phosphate-specific signal transduction histidine kinase
MRNAKLLQGINHGLLVAALYCAAFVLLWRLSQDQFYLPAGLRVASFLLLPRRLWAYALIGDAAAVFGLRWRIVDQYSLEWVIVPTLLLPPLLAVGPLLMRRMLNPWLNNLRWVPLGLAAVAVWMAVWMIVFDQIFGGAQGAASVTRFVRFVTGYYLGMLMLVPLAMLWAGRHEKTHQAAGLWRDAAVGVGLVMSLALAVNVSLLEPSLKQLLLIFMIAPPTALAFLHGWRGAALGVVAANAAIALSLPAANVLGAHDQTVFVAHQVLAAAGTILLIAGAMVSSHFDQARRLGVAEAHAMDIARASFLQTDRHMRDRVIVLAQMQARIVDSKTDLIRRLKEHGRYAAAMEVMRDAALHDELFEAHASALYPLSIDTLGLYDALQSPSFTAVWTDQRPVRFCLRGQPRRLSVPLQVAAYRCACNAIALLSCGDPARYRVHARTWQSGQMRGIAVVVQAHGGAGEMRTRASTLAELELEGRLKMHGGALRRRRGDRLVFLLAEPLAASASGYSDEPGTMDQLSPLVP